MTTPPFDSADPKLARSIVCWADLLGFTELSREAVELGESQRLLSQLSGALTNALDELRKPGSGWGSPSEYEVRTFTDNLVLAYPIVRNDDGESETARMFILFAEYQARLAAKGFFVRGGLACGDVYAGEDIVFGPALTAAHSLDASGGPPRLVLHESLKELVRLHSSFYGDGWMPYDRMLLEGEDGVVFVNYLSVAFDYVEEAGIDGELLSAHREHIVSNLEKYRLQPSVLAKYRWARDYHNWVVGNAAAPYQNVSDPDMDPERAAFVIEMAGALDYLIPDVPENLQFRMFGGAKH